VQQPEPEALIGREHSPERDVQPDILESRLLYVMSGVLGGLGLSLWAILHAVGTKFEARSAIIVVFGIVAGALAGSNLHSNRDWDFFGKHTVLVRWTLACSGAASLTAGGGVLVGALPAAYLWLYGVGGAVFGFVSCLRIHYEK
jgi:hypothetical protein